MYDALRDPIAQPLLAQGGDDLLPLHLHQVMWALDKVLQCLILTSTSRALADSCDVLSHMHDWEPAMHYLTSLHPSDVRQFTSDVPNRCPVDAIKYLIRPFILFQHVCSCRTRTTRSVQVFLYLRGDPPTPDSQHCS